MFSLELIVRQVFKELKRVSLQRVLRYFDTTIARMVANDLEGRLAERIAKSQAVRTQFFGSASAADAALIAQTSMTDKLDALIDRMEFELRDRYEGAVRGAFGKSSDEYKTFFPNGLTEYDDPTREAAPLLFERLAKAATAHADGLAPAVVTALTGYKTAWDTQRKDQLEGIGETGDEDDKVKAAREAVYLQQYLTLHQLCVFLEGDEARILHYFDDSILAPRRRKDDDEQGDEEQQPKA